MAPENAKIFQMLQAGVIFNAELLCEEAGSYFYSTHQN
jgi:hypothetical protein